MTLWGVRAGGEGDQEEDAIANSIVTIGWNQLGDLSRYDNFENLFNYFKSIYPKKEGQTISEYNNSARLLFGEVWAFLKKIKIGDLVVLPRKKTNEVFIGKIIGDYEYKQYTEKIKHTRKVKWFKSIDRSKIPPAILRSFNTGLTVFNVEKNNAEEFIRKIYLI